METARPEPPLLHRMSPRQWTAIDICVSAVLFLGGLGSLLGTSGQGLPHHFVLLLMALCLATLPLPLRRRFPLLVLASVTIGILVGTLLNDGLAGTPVLALPLYTVAAQEARQRSLAAACIVAIACIAAWALATLDHSNGNNVAFFDATDNLIAIAVAWFIGDSVRSRRAFVEGTAVQAEQRRHLEVERAQTAVAEERLHIARELHDIVAHSLSVIAIQSGVGRHVLDTQPEETRKALAAIETTSRSALEDLRWVVGVLRRDDADGPSFRPAPGMDDLERLMGESRDAGLEVSLCQQGEAISVPPSMDLSLYRIVQEALTNITKHADTSHAVVDVTYGHDEVLVCVTNDGPPKPVANSRDSRNGSSHNGHHGIVGMRERAEMYGGSLTAGPRAGGGFEVRARLPLKPFDS